MKPKLFFVLIMDSLDWWGWDGEESGLLHVGDFCMLIDSVNHWARPEQLGPKFSSNECKKTILYI